MSNAPLGIEDQDGEPVVPLSEYLARHSRQQIKPAKPKPRSVWPKVIAFVLMAAVWAWLIYRNVQQFQGGN